MRLFLAFAVLMFAAAQAAQAATRIPAPTPVQHGEQLFQQHCSLCHTPQPYAEIGIGRKLGKGVIAGVEDVVREIIKTGRPDVMPGFQYALGDNEVNAIIAYLGTVDEEAPVIAKPLPAAPISHEGALLLTGTVKSPTGGSLEGVVVSAQIDGQPITVSVYTDKDGNYYFPPMASGTYRVWAQTVGFETERFQVPVKGSVTRQDFQLRETKDFVHQLAGGDFVEALPIDTSQHRRMRDVLLHSCASCHSLAVTLRNRYDAAGWNAIVSTMSRISGIGVVGTESKPHYEHFKKDLVAYLTEIRGPKPSPMKYAIPGRPSGDSTLPVFYQYDTPLEEYGGYSLQNGLDWSQGTPSHSYGGRAAHDATRDLNGNLWVNYFAKSTRTRTYGRMNLKTGALTDFIVPLPDQSGFGATSHAMILMPDGNILTSLAFVSNEGKKLLARSLAVIDTKTGKAKVYSPPQNISDVYAHLDFGDDGSLWGSTLDGAVRVDPKTGQWTEFKSPIPAADAGATYGITGLKGGGAMWTQIGIDKLVYTDGTSRPVAIDVPRIRALSQDDILPEDSALYASKGYGSENVGPPWQQGPRRIQADRTGDDIWSGGHLGNTLIRVNRKTLSAQSYKVPKGNYAPYMPVVDAGHNVWVGMQGTPTVLKFEPKSEIWTYYRWPSLGAMTRHTSLYEPANGPIEIISAFWGVPAVGRMVMRTTEDLAVLKSQVAAAR